MKVFHKVWFQFSIITQDFSITIFINFLAKKQERSFLRKFGKYIAFNVSQLENCGDEPTPSQHKYRKNFKLNNCASSDCPDTRHICEPLLNAVLYFHELKNSTQRLSTKFGFRFQISRKLDLSRKVWFQFLISQRIFPKRIFSTKFGFSFPLSRKIFDYNFH